MKSFRHPDLESLRGLLRQFFKFGLIGVVGFAVDWLMLQVGLSWLGLKPVAAGFFSFPFAVTATWIGNRHFTFRETPKQSPLKQFIKFVIVCAVGLVFNRGTYTLCVTFIPLVYAHPVLGLLAGTGAGMLFNFFAARRHVFGQNQG